jgi:hypothetical protein
LLLLQFSKRLDWWKMIWRWITDINTCYGKQVKELSMVVLNVLIHSSTATYLKVSYSSLINIVGKQQTFVYVRACTHSICWTVHVHISLPTYYTVHILYCLCACQSVCNRGGHSVNCKPLYWCGSCKLPVKNNTQVVYMHLRLTVNGCVKSFLKNEWLVPNFSPNLWLLKLV